jgi:K+-sensing histidine kinase KdpD
MVRLATLELVAWGAGDLAEQLDQIELHGGQMTAEQQQARADLYAVTCAHGRWAAARTRRLLANDARLPACNELARHVSRALASVAAAGGFDHLFRVCRRASGGQLVIGRWPQPKRRRRV